MRKVFFALLCALVAGCASRPKTEPVAGAVAVGEVCAKPKVLAPDAVASAKAFADAKAKIDSRIAVFANRPAIATDADAMLSKLISANSPILRSWMKRRELEEAPEDKVVRTWRDYYARSMVLTRYPQPIEAVNVEMEKLVDGILQEVLTDAVVSRLQSAFREAKKLALAKIDSFAMSDAAKAAIRTRVRAIELHRPVRLKTANNSRVPLEIIDWSVAYDPAFNQINIGVNALAYESDETRKAVFLHEIGHSFDSCRWGAFFDEALGPWPFAAVGECLRAPTSVYARKRDDTALQSLIKAGKVDLDVASSLLQNPTCNRSFYPPPGVQADQLPEAFADWFSAEALAPVAASLDRTQLRRDLCEARDLNQGSSYPANRDRLLRIYRAHPAFAVSGGEAKYCRF